MADKVKVKRWIRSGELDERYTDQDDILDDCGRLGEVMFEGEDGKMYVITVEAVISEANPDYVKDVLTAEEDLRRTYGTAKTHTAVREVRHQARASGQGST